MSEDAAPGRFGIRFRKEISIENVIGFAAILVTIVSFLISQDRDRALLVKGQAQDLRASASDTMAQFARLEALSEFYFLQIEPLAVESSQRLSETRNLEAARDVLWHGITAKYVENEERFFNDRFTESYYTIAAAYPDLHGEIEGAMTQLRAERRNAYALLLTETQQDVLSFSGQLNGFRSEVLGNQLRQTMFDIEAAHLERVNVILAPVNQHLACVVSMSDDQLVYGRGGEAAPGERRGLAAICDESEQAN